MIINKNNNENKKLKEKVKQAVSRGSKIESVERKVINELFLKKALWNSKIVRCLFLFPLLTLLKSK